MFTVMRRLDADHFTRGCLGLIICIFVFACSEEAENLNSKSTPDNGTVIIVPANGSGTNRLTSIPISFQNSQSSRNVFSLLDTSAFTIELSDCLSGYSTTVTQAKVDGLEVYSYDRECLAKLTQFTVDGRTYFPTIGEPFTTWQVGDTAIFDEVGEPGTAPLKMVVLSTLGDPVTANDKIIYGWSTIVEGSTQSILWTTIGFSSDIQHLSNLPPSFSIKSIEFLGLTAGEGGRYRFVLECSVNMGITNICDSVDLTDLDYKLIADTYGGTIDKIDGDDIFSSAGDTVTLPDDRVAPGVSGTTNGGFITIILDGPDNLASNPNMLFIIRSYGESFQYFNVDVTVSANY